MSRYLIGDLAALATTTRRPRASAGAAPPRAAPQPAPGTPSIDPVAWKKSCLEARLERRARELTEPGRVVEFLRGAGARALAGFPPAVRAELQRLARKCGVSLESIERFGHDVPGRR